MSTLRNSTLAAITVFASGSTASLSIGANALSSPLDPTTSAFGGSGTTPGYTWAYFVFSTGSTALGSAPSGYPSVILFFRLPGDGTLTGTVTTWCTDLGRSTTPVEPVGAAIPLDTTNTTQVRSSQPVAIPAVPFEVVLVNAASVALPAGWSLSLVPASNTAS